MQKNVIEIYSTFDQWTRAKSFDTFGIFGPCIVNDIDPMNLRVTSKLNSETVQDYNTSDMFFNVFEIVSHLSKDMTLYPGDIISSGCPVTAEIQVGDTVEVEIEGIGTLINPVVSEC